MPSLYLLLSIISAVAIGLVTVAAVVDLVKGASFGSTIRRWASRVADAFFSAP